MLIIAKLGEIALKGLNKRTFEEILIKNIKNRLNNKEKFGEFTLTRSQSCIYIIPKEKDSRKLDAAFNALRTVFGIAMLNKATTCEKNFGSICENVPLDFLRTKKSFKVEAKRADKKFPMNSPEICRELGGYILEQIPELTVDVINPEVTVHVDIREEFAYIYSEKIEGARGLPVGSSGSAMLLLSGGIDSPVAGYLTAKRGMRLCATYFETPPYTSERATEKVKSLVEKLYPYCGYIRLNVVNFTAVAEAIKSNCKEEYGTVLLRRAMMREAERLATEQDCSLLVTGESLGQVASQTSEAILCTDVVTHLPIIRPCICMDKTEIVEIAREIETYETSILPYEDCCVVFTPRHPKVHPKLSDVEIEESRL
ncbi:MAG: tRNA 4-thiouridine(8) synthase ThiI [Ruminococcus sp.]|jgi:thiamine biosynthesis protein ThiI|nr:tRNA 4-thiouridine(8) synthase ThiI [Ruminococcus sp.]